MKSIEGRIQLLTQRSRRARRELFVCLPHRHPTPWARSSRSPSPVAHLGCRRQVPVPERLYIVLGDLASLLGIGQEGRYLLLQVGEVLGHFDEVLLWTVGTA